MTTRAKDRDGIQKLGPQHYRVVLELPRDPSTGQRRRKHRTVHGPLEAAKRTRAEMVAQLEAGRLVGSADQTLGDYLRSWLAYRKGQVSDRTWERYDSLMRSAVIPAIGGVKMRDLSSQHLRDYFAACRQEPSPRFPERRDAEGNVVSPARPISPTTVHHRFVVLKSALRQAVSDGIITRNPLDDVRPPKRIREQPEILTEERVAALVGAMGGSAIETVVYLAYMTGARLGELLALRWRDIDLEAGVIRIHRALIEPMRATEASEWFDFKAPKSGQGRSIDVGAATIARLKAHKVEQSTVRLSLGPIWRDLELVFPNLWQARGVAPGEPMRPSTVSRIFRQKADAAGFAHVRFHDMRHAHATVLLRQGIAPHVVSRRLGHSDVALTLRVYSHVLPGQEREAVDAFEAGFERAIGDL